MKENEKKQMILIEYDSIVDWINLSTLYKLDATIAIMCHLPATSTEFVFSIY